MIRITQPNIDDLITEHCENVEYLICSNVEIEKSIVKVENKMNVNFRLLIVSKPERLRFYIEKFKDIDFADFKSNLKKLYNIFRNKYGVKFIKGLGINVCPYCNREYIFRLEDTKKQEARVLATFDHFYDKARYPFLALSFYNLIPSCSICNSKFKTAVDFHKLEHLHPYEDDFNSLAKFHLKITKPNFYHSTDGIDVKLKENNMNDEKIRNTIETFRLNDIYKEHSDIALELIKKQYMYSEEYLETLYKQYEGTMFKNYEHLKGTVFGNYVSNDEIHKRPLAKFTKDILSDLE